MTLIEWEEGRHLVGVDEMDSVHQEFTLIVNRLGETQDPSIFKSLFIQLLEHTQEHFALEDQLMEETGFRGFDEHREEHERVLKQMHYINEKVQAGNLDFGRAFVEDLPRWFDLHADTMDNALAVHLKAAPEADSFAV
ncbi:hemerythrin domain-containing protein [uncultured Cohaesibacter sp.]|uniref:bacteriohemerythrin n=1 Tax=uncultured Cohaesibacter sp. TaxID=1002546 RepID=UPI002AAC317A|nr:hemerythrin domain-containing protein [uncultured Cohaesibacter sp.]